MTGVQTCALPISKEGAGSRCRPGCLHLPEPKLERSFAKPNSRSADEYAFLWVEEGIEDGDVLPSHEAGSAGYPVHS